MTLGDYLQTVSQDRGAWNCSSLPGDWCASRGHPDFFAPWRDVTDDPDIADACAGGLLPLWEGAIGGCLPVAEAPYQAGDIGVLSTHGIEAGAIFTGERWAFRKPKGLAFATLPDDAVLKAWRP